MIYKVSSNSDLLPGYVDRLRPLGMELYQVIKGSKGLWVLAPIDSYDQGDGFKAALAHTTNTSLSKFKKQLDVFITTGGGSIK